MPDNIAMVLPISGVHELAATASGVDQAGNAVRVDLTAYVIDAADAGIAVSIVEAEVLNEAVIPDGTGGFTKPTLVTATSVKPTTTLPPAPLMYRHRGPGSDERFLVNSIYQIQVLASMVFGNVSTTISVYPLNSGLSASIALAKSDVIKLPILPDPEVPGQPLRTVDGAIDIAAHSHLAVIVKLDKFINKVASSQGIREFIDHYSYAAANSGSRSRTPG
jgi:hypothetical protein